MSVTRTFADVSKNLAKSESNFVALSK